MDSNQIIDHVIVAVVTMVTTAVVMRLSLNKGQLGVTSKLKARFTPKFRAYTKVIFSLVLSIFLNVYFARFIADPAAPPVSRDTVFLIILLTLALFSSGIMTGVFVSNLVALYRQERKQRELEKERAILQPVLDELKVAVDMAHRTKEQGAKAPSEIDHP